VLLNGASGHRGGFGNRSPLAHLREVAAAAVALIRTRNSATDDLAAFIPGPDYPGGGQIISSAEDNPLGLHVGRGSPEVRARWKIEDLARGNGSGRHPNCRPARVRRRCSKRSRS